MTSLILTGSAVFLGAALQRSTGLGFTLVSGPFLVLVLGPFNGVVLANVLSLVTCSVVFILTWRNVRWKVAAQLIAGVAVSVVPGAILARVIAESWLLIVVGVISVSGALAVALGQTIPIMRSRLGAFIAGLASGFSNVTAGIGGPALAMYGVSAGLLAAPFIATAQLVGATANALSLLAKQPFTVPWAVIGVGLAAASLGIVLGQLLAPRLGERRGRSIVLLLAIIGGLAAVAKGAVALRA